MLEKYKREYVFFQKIAARYRFPLQEIKESSLSMYHEYLQMHWNQSINGKLIPMIKKCTRNNMIYLHTKDDDMHLFLFEIPSKTERKYISLGPIMKDDCEKAGGLAVEFIEVLWEQEAQILSYPLTLKRIHPVILEIMRYIEEDISKDHTLRVLAKRMNISPGHLSKLFTQETGMSLTEYVNRKKISYGVYLLEATDDKITAIAMKTGIGDNNYFSRLFKKYIGVSPAQYRRKNT